VKVDYLNNTFDIQDCQTIPKEADQNYKPSNNDDQDDDEELDDEDE